MRDAVHDDKAALGALCTFKLNNMKSAQSTLLKLKEQKVNLHSRQIPH
jgi:hypothetical protein